MAQNPDIKLLDSGQIVKRIYDGANDAIRTVPAEATSYSIELDATDGDSVLVYGNGFAQNSTSLSSASAGVVIAAAACVGQKSFQLYGIVTALQGASTAGDLIARIEVSPSDTDNVWYNSSVSLTVPSASALNSVTASSLLTTLIARRVRVSLTTNSLAGNDRVTLYLVGNSL